MKRLSVIMPVYNGESYVSNMIDSVMAQEYTDLELIVVDDGSSDGTVQIVERYANQDRRIHLVTHSANKGVSAARNTGLELARGEYVALVDADDRLHPAMYKKLICAIEECSCDMAMCRIYYENGGAGEEELLPNIGEGVLTEGDYQKLVNGLIDINQYFFAGTVRYVFRKSILQDSRFDTRIFYREDLAFLFELLSVRRKIYYADFVGYYYMRNQGSAVERYQKELYENLMYVNGKIFDLSAENNLLEEHDRLYAMKILEAVSLSISNLYRKDAPVRTVGAYLQQVRRFRMELESLKGVKLDKCLAKYKPLLFCSRLRADFAIHLLYSWKEKVRQKKMHG